MKIIVGLGNPGKQYEKTRHNAGWMVLDSLAKMLKAEEFRENKKFRSFIAEAEFAGEKILLVKPATFMNLSGEAILSIMSYYKAKSDDIWVAYDDLDLPAGEVRIRKEGGPGTHNGMKSVIQHIGNKLPRFRIGIEGRSAEQKQHIDAADYVLSSFTSGEKETMEKTVKKVTQAIITALESGMETAMDQYNG